MENIISNKQTAIEIKSVNHRKSGHAVTAPIETAAFFIFASSAVVSNLSNYIEKEPKQQIIQNVQEKGDVDMSNNKDTSTQEVRQKDLDSLEKMVNEKLKTSTTYVDGKFNTSSTYIDGKFDTLTAYIDGKFDTLNQKIDEIESNINKEVDRRNKRTNLLVAIIGILAPILAQIIFKFIIK